MHMEGVAYPVGGGVSIILCPLAAIRHWGAVKPVRSLLGLQGCRIITLRGMGLVSRCWGPIHLAILRLWVLWAGGTVVGCCIRDWMQVITVMTRERDATPPLCPRTPATTPVGPAPLTSTMGAYLAACQAPSSLDIPAGCLVSTWLGNCSND